MLGKRVASRVAGFFAALSDHVWSLEELVGLLDEHERTAGGMKIKNVCESILAGAIVALFSYYALSVPATLAAIAIRRKMPDAWFSGLIVWYAHFAVIAASVVIAAIACRRVYKHATQSGPRV
jgi:hypothetical protein